MDANATTYFDILAEFLEQFATPYAMIFGNHDDMDFVANYPNGTHVEHPAKTLRRDLLDPTT